MVAAALFVLGRPAVSAKAAAPRLWARIGPGQRRLAG
jgi:hypothetical protein